MGSEFAKKEARVNHDAPKNANKQRRSGSSYRNPMDRWLLMGLGGGQGGSKASDYALHQNSPNGVENEAINCQWQSETACGYKQQISMACDKSVQRKGLSLNNIGADCMEWLSSAKKDLLRSVIEDYISINVTNQNFEYHLSLLTSAMHELILVGESGHICATKLRNAIAAERTFVLLQIKKRDGQ